MILDNMVQLSICIPTYNRSTYLAETLQKCISDIEDENLHSTVEILVGDNASSDDTEGVCLTLENKHQYIHYVKNKENIGAERNWLNLISLAQGHYVWILSDDDDFLPGLVADILKITDKADYSVIHLNYTFFEGADKNITFGRRNHETVDYAGRGWQSFFEKTNFSSSFISSNIFSRDNFIANLTSIEPYKANPWFQLYVVKNIINDKAYYCYSALKLKMRALTVEESRREKHVGGSLHFYFNAHVAFIEFLVYINWKNSDFRNRMISEQFFQIFSEKTTWRENVGSEDYHYWILMIQKLISIGYFNSSIIFWCRDVLVMLLPTPFAVLIKYYYTSKHKLGNWLRACESSHSSFKKAIFSIYSKYNKN